jgi:hypothetical protein
MVHVGSGRSGTYCLQRRSAMCCVHVLCALTDRHCMCLITTQPVDGRVTPISNSPCKPP